MNRIQLKYLRRHEVDTLCQHAGKRVRTRLISFFSKNGESDVDLPKCLLIYLSVTKVAELNWNWDIFQTNLHLIRRKTANDADSPECVASRFPSLELLDFINRLVIRGTLGVENRWVKCRRSYRRQPRLINSAMLILCTQNIFIVRYAQTSKTRVKINHLVVLFDHRTTLHRTIFTIEGAHPRFWLVFCLFYF